MKKLFVIGLDSAAPSLVFEEFRPQLPNLSKLMENGIYGNLTSCIPAITIPAWMAMMTGKSPGELGLYGFRHRKNYSYDEIWLANSHRIKHPAVWDALARENKKVCLVGVPPTYPPKPVSGHLVSCFITPDAEKDYTYPSSLKREIEDLVGEYVFDVEYRREDKDIFLKELYDMTEKRFRVVEYLMRSKEWDFFMWVEIGVDRIHHGFWKYFDKAHHLYQPSKYEHAIRDYYKYLDEGIGRLVALLDENTAVLVVSDHGAKRMKGAFCINEWLAKEGYLVLRESPKGVVNLENTPVDWGQSTAWGWGGYYARVFLNVDGREPRGVIKPDSYEGMRNELATKLAQVRGPKGEEWQTKVFKPEEIYPENSEDCPDLMVYFDELSWRSAGTLGHNALYLRENDTGPDDAVHDHDGIFILYDPSQLRGGEKVDSSIRDVAPTIFHLMGTPLPEHLTGESILWKIEQGQL